MKLEPGKLYKITNYADYNIIGMFIKTEEVPNSYGYRFYQFLIGKKIENYDLTYFHLELIL